MQELAKLEEQQKDRDESPSELIEPNGPVLPAAIKSAEQRLKFALPEEHKQLLQDYGAWSYSSSRCLSAEEINLADKQILSIWGSPASEFDSLSEKSKTLYQASVMLFVEGGDGYGALLYHPTSSGGDFYWIHQDNLDQPVKLVDNQDKPRDYSGAMRWIIANQILFCYDDAFDGTFIDRSLATALPYQLRLNFPSQKQLETKQLEARLEVEWSKFE
ncbi:MAG: SMI1/KNR4 family protein [Pirellula sp.]